MQQDIKGPLQQILRETVQLALEPETRALDLAYHTRRLLLLSSAPLLGSLDDRADQARTDLDAGRPVTCSAVLCHLLFDPQYSGKACQAWAKTKGALGDSEFAFGDNQPSTPSSIGATSWTRLDASSAGASTESPFQPKQ